MDPVTNTIVNNTCLSALYVLTSPIVGTVRIVANLARLIFYDLWLFLFKDADQYGKKIKRDCIQILQGLVELVVFIGPIAILIYARAQKKSPKPTPVSGSTTSPKSPRSRPSPPPPTPLPPRPTPVPPRPISLRARALVLPPRETNARNKLFTVHGVTQHIASFVNVHEFNCFRSTCYKTSQLSFEIYMRDTPNSIQNMIYRKRSINFQGELKEALANGRIRIDRLNLSGLPITREMSVYRSLHLRALEIGGADIGDEKLKGDRDLKDITSKPELTELTLDCDSCGHRLTTLNPVFSNNRLKKLTLILGADLWTFPDGVQPCSSLEELNVRFRSNSRNCGDLLYGIQRFSSIRKLTFSTYAKSTEMALSEIIPNLKNLEEISLMGEGVGRSYTSGDIDALQSAGKLTKLVIRNIKLLPSVIASLVNLSSSLTKLTTIELTVEIPEVFSEEEYNSIVGAINLLSNIKQLKNLNVKFAPEVKGLLGMAALLGYSSVRGIPTVKDETWNSKLLAHVFGALGSKIVEVQVERSEIMYSPQVLDALSSSPCSCRTLRLRGFSDRNISIEILRNLLRQLPNLEKLDLLDVNLIGEIGADSVLSIQNLKKLMLFSCRMPRSFIQILARSIPLHFKQLSLSGLNITTEGESKEGMAMAELEDDIESLLTKGNLRELELRDMNNFFTDKTITALMRHHRELVILDLGCDGMVGSLRASPRLTRAGVAAALSSSTSLLRVELCDSLGTSSHPTLRNIKV